MKVPVVILVDDYPTSDSDEVMGQKNEADCQYSHVPEGECQDNPMHSLQNSSSEGEKPECSRHEGKGRITSKQGTVSHPRKQVLSQYDISADILCKIEETELPIQPTESSLNPRTVSATHPTVGKAIPCAPENTEKITKQIKPEHKTDVSKRNSKNGLKAPTSPPFKLPFCRDIRQQVISPTKGVQEIFPNWGQILHPDFPIKEFSPKKSNVNLISDFSSNAKSPKRIDSTLVSDRDNLQIHNEIEKQKEKTHPKESSSTDSNNSPAFTLVKKKTLEDDNITAVSVKSNSHQVTSDNTNNRLRKNKDTIAVKSGTKRKCSDSSGEKTSPRKEIKTYHISCGNTAEKVNKTGQSGEVKRQKLMINYTDDASEVPCHVDKNHTKSIASSANTKKSYLVKKSDFLQNMAEKNVSTTSFISETLSSSAKESSPTKPVVFNGKRVFYIPNKSEPETVDNHYLLKAPVKWRSPMKADLVDISSDFEEKSRKILDHYLLNPVAPTENSQNNDAERNLGLSQQCFTNDADVSRYSKSNCAVSLRKVLKKSNGSDRISKRNSSKREDDDKNKSKGTSSRESNIIKDEQTVSAFQPKSLKDLASTVMKVSRNNQSKDLTCMSENNGSKTTPHENSLKTQCDMKKLNIRLEKLTGIPLDRPVLITASNIKNNVAKKSCSMSLDSNLHETSQEFKRKDTNETKKTGTKVFYVLDKKDSEKNNQNLQSSKHEFAIDQNHFLNMNKSASVSDHIEMQENKEMNTNKGNRVKSEVVPIPITEDVFKHLSADTNIVSSLRASVNIKQDSRADNSDATAQCREDSKLFDKATKGKHFSSKITVAELLRQKRANNAEKRSINIPLQIYGRAVNGGIYNTTLRICEDASVEQHENKQLSSVNAKAQEIPDIGSTDNKNFGVTTLVHGRSDTNKHVSVTENKDESGTSVNTLKTPTAVKISSVVPLTDPKLKNQQLFSVRIGDKMFIVKQLDTYYHVHSKSGSNRSSLPAPKLKSELKPTPVAASSKKKSGVKKGEISRNDLKKKIIRLSKGPKQPFEKLLKALALIPLKTKIKRLKKLAANSAKKIEFSHTVSGFPTSDQTSSTGCMEHLSPSPKAPQRNIPMVHTSKSAWTVTIFKDSVGNCKKTISLTKINYVSGRNSEYHRWYKNADYPCTLYFSETNRIERIDVESIKQGLYLVSASSYGTSMPALDEPYSCRAVLALYPPLISSIPVDSMAIVVGQIFENCTEDHYGVNEFSENEDLGKAVNALLGRGLNDEISRSIDARYAPSTDQSMTPKQHSHKFYSSSMHDYFTNGILDSDSSSAVESNYERKREEASRAIEMLQSRSSVTLSKYNAKAMALKIKQNELFESCRLLEQSRKNKNQVNNVASAPSETFMSNRNDNA